MGGREKTKLMLKSTLVEIEVEVGVELGNKSSSKQAGAEPSQAQDS